MKKSTQKWLAIVVIGCLAGAYCLGLFAQYGYQSPFLATGTGPAPGPTWTDTEKVNYQNGIGMFEVSHTCYDTLAPATAFTHTTEYNLFWFTKRGATYTYHGTGGTAAAPVYVDLTPEDNGYLYVTVETKSAQNVYTDVDKIRATNSWIDSVLYIDIDDDTIKEFVFKYDMKGHSIPNSGYPAVSFHGHLWAYDSSFTGVNSLADLGNIGATKTTQWMRWYLTFSAAAKAVALSKIEIKTNITDTSIMQLQNVQVPGRGFLDDSAFVFDELATYYRWTYTYGTTYENAYYLNCPTGTDYTQIDLDVKADFTLGTTPILVTMTVWYIINYAETTTTSTDTCESDYA